MKSGDVKVLLRARRRESALLAAARRRLRRRARRRSRPSCRSRRCPTRPASARTSCCPTTPALESWGDAAPRPGVRSLVQPSIRPLFDTQALGDSLLGIARAMGEGVAAPAARRLLPRRGRGGLVRHRLARGARARRRVRRRAPTPAPGAGRERGAHRVARAAARGRRRLHRCCRCPRRCSATAAAPICPGSRRRRIPITKITWQSWAEISERVAAESLGVRARRRAAIETPFGALEVPAWPRGGIRDDVIAVAIGQGHTVGRYASLEHVGQPGVARGVNVISVLPAVTDEAGGRAWLAAKARVSADRSLPAPALHPGRRQQARPPARRGDLAGGAGRGRSVSPWAANQAPAVTGSRHAGAGRRGGGAGARRGARRHAADEHATGLRTRSCAPSTPSRDSQPDDPVPLGHDDRHRPLHRLQRLRGRLLRREQHPDRRRGAGHARARRCRGCASSATSATASRR